MSKFVERFVKETNLEELAGCLTIVEPHRVRIRRPPVDRLVEGWTDIPI